MKYLVLGAGGMAGHLISIYLQEQNQTVEGIARRKLPFCKTYLMDVADLVKLREVIITNKYDFIVNCIGVLNQKADNDIANAVLINSYLPHYLTKVVSDLPTKVIHISTDCVFSGKKGPYMENSHPDGENYYAQTKALGEIKSHRHITFRNSIVGPDINPNGIGLFNWYMLQENEIKGYEKSIWTGVTTLTLAKAILKIGRQNMGGIYNLVNNQSISKYQLLMLFNKYSNKNLKINKVDGIIHNKSLKCTRLHETDFVVPDYEDMISEMFDWIDSHKDLYPHYFRQVKL